MLAVEDLLKVYKSDTTKDVFFYNQSPNRVVKTENDRLKSCWNPHKIKNDFLCVQLPLKSSQVVAEGVQQRLVCRGHSGCERTTQIQPWIVSQTSVEIVLQKFPVLLVQTVNGCCLIQKWHFSVSEPLLIVPMWLLSGVCSPVHLVRISTYSVQTSLCLASSLCLQRCWLEPLPF